jgi:hypothetical protein
MGDWRTVNVVGTMSEQDAAVLRKHLGYSWDRHDPAMEHFGPLSFNREHPGLAGLGDWPAPQMNRCGNLAERDYSVDDVAMCLRELVRIAPTMLLKVHCGGEYESQECVATISVGEGLVVIGAPEVATVSPAPEEQVRENLLRNLMRPSL